MPKIEIVVDHEQKVVYEGLDDYEQLQIRLAVVRKIMFYKDEADRLAKKQKSITYKDLRAGRRKT